MESLEGDKFGRQLKMYDLVRNPTAGQQFRQHAVRIMGTKARPGSVDEG